MESKLPVEFHYLTHYKPEDVTEISISEKVVSWNIERLGAMTVSFHVPDTYLYTEFKTRDSSGNVTELGKKLGIRTRDKRISIYSSRGQAIRDYLYSLAWKYAGGLTKGKAEIKDKTVYGQAREAAESLAKGSIEEIAKCQGLGILNC